MAEICTPAKVEVKTTQIIIKETQTRVEHPTAFPSARPFSPSAVYVRRFHPIAAQLSTPAGLRLCPTPTAVPADADPFALFISSSVPALNTAAPVFCQV